jgi:thiol:disulfide interchange protein DsbD
MHRSGIAAAILLGVSRIACSPPPHSNGVTTIALGAPSADIANPPQTTADPASVAPKKERPRPIAWETSEPDARAKARREGRPMIVYLRAEWTVASLRMERDVWTDERVARAAREFIALKLDLSADDADAELFAERYGAEGIPATVVLNARGDRTAKLIGEVDAPAIIDALRRASEEP